MQEIKNVSPKLHRAIMVGVPSWPAMALPRELPGLETAVLDPEKEIVKFSLGEGETGEWMIFVGNVEVEFRQLLAEDGKSVTLEPSLRCLSRKRRRGDLSGRMALEQKLMDAFGIQTNAIVLEEEVVELALTFFGVGYKDETVFCLLSEARQVVESFLGQNRLLLEKLRNQGGEQDEKDLPHEP